MLIRTARLEDAPALLAIYAPYVTGTAVTFEYEVPTLAEFAGRIQRTLEKYPYLVLEEEGRMLGYAYAGPFKNRAAYDWAVETTIYLSPNARGMGNGRALYTALEEKLKAMGVQNLYACISATGQEDEYLTNVSRHFHAHLGYALCGSFRCCGFKFGRWYDMIWMEKHLGAHGKNPEEILRQRT